MRIKESHIRAVNRLISSALAYEKATGGKRRAGITGEIGEVKVCYLFNLALEDNPQTAGFDAVDGNGQRVQIKTRRGTEGRRRPGRFKKMTFDYALLCLLHDDYSIAEIWHAHRDELAILLRAKSNDRVTVREFTKRGTPVHPDGKSVPELLGVSNRALYARIRRWEL